MPHNKKVLNFGAGPAKLPEAILCEAQGSLFDCNDTGMSILEMSHRSGHFDAILQDAKLRLRRLLGVPESHEILFMQGGGTLQFSAVPMNLMGCNPQNKSPAADYIITGHWSRQALNEARRLGYAVNGIETVTRSPDGSFRVLPGDQLKARLSPNPKYIYYCDNETIDGIEFPYSTFLHEELGLGPETVMVADMSSNFLSRPVQVDRFGLIFATAQKNVGPAGVTIVIVRKDLLPSSPEPAQQFHTPLMLDYNVALKSDSLYNTPPVFSIYVTGLVLKWLEENFAGSLELVDQFSKAKASLICSVIDNSNGFYTNKIPKIFRSRMNVVLRIAGPKGEELEDAFVKEAQSAGMIQLRGHRSVGGIRCSLYNAITIEETQALQSFLLQYQTKHK